jgi:hypothetical protein
VRRRYCVVDPAIVTVVVAITVPPAPVAVSLYVVVVDGVTFTDPAAATVPTP